MNLYQINAEIEQLEHAADDGLLIDPETGELISFEEALDRLRMEKAKKIENVALWCKNLASDVVALKAEEDNLAKRRRAAEAKQERLKAYLLNAITEPDGRVVPFHGTKAVVSVRNNAPSVIISDEAILPMEFKIQKIEVKPDKKSIGEVLKRGIAVPGAHLEAGRSVLIK